MSPTDSIEGCEPHGVAARAHRGRAKVLVIDDEPLLGRTLKLALDESFDVALETSGERARQRLLAGEAFDVIFCDLGLPDLSGMDVFRSISSKRPELAACFVLITGGAVTDEARAFVDQHAGPLLHKPFTVAQVERLVEEITSRS